MKKRSSATRSELAQHFTGKLSDANAICKYGWAQLKDYPCEDPAHLLWRPHDLSAALRSQGARERYETSLKSLESEARQAVLGLLT